METVFRELLIFMIVVWTTAVALNKIGLPTIMGELIMGVIVGPAVLGLIQPSEVIDTLAQLGIFFLLLHAGVETHPAEFFTALKRSTGIALVGAIVPFSLAMGVALMFGLSVPTAVFVGLVMTATAVVITLKVLRDLGLNHTPMARVIIAACVIDDLLTLVVFSFALNLLNGGEVNLLQILDTAGRVVLFFGVSFAIGYWVYPLFRKPFQDRHGKGLTFVLVLGLAGGLFAHMIGLHIILGAYIAGLFFDHRVASGEQLRKVEDRLGGIAYSFLGPIFFISLGFHLTFDVLEGSGLWFIVALTLAIFIGQVVSAGGMARRAGFNASESLFVGVGMCGRAEMAFILSSLGLSLGLLTPDIFSVLIFTAFLLNLATPVAMKLLASRLKIAPPSEVGDQ